MNSNEIEVFEFNDTNVRVIEREGEPWFVLADLCNVLGLTRGASQIAERLDDGVRLAYPIQDSLGRTQQATIVSESGMYEVIIRSDKPEAKAFRRWVTSEVLPSIRKTGTYSVQPALSGPELMAAALIEANRTLEAQRTELEAAKPKVLFADAVATSESMILIGDLAKILRGNGVVIGANRLFEWMRKKGYLIQRAGTDWNMPTQRSMELGLFKVKETAITHSDGRITLNTTTKVTGKGQQYFINKFRTGAAA